MGDFILKSVSIKDGQDTKTLAYYTNDLNHYKKVIVLLSPGCTAGDFFKNYIDCFPDNYLLIAPDYPGRDKSTPDRDNSISHMAIDISILLKSLNITKYTLIGLSFGGMVAFELNRIDIPYVEKIIIIASGELFTPFQKLIINSLLFISLYSGLLRKFYLLILIHFKSFHDLTKDDLKSIDEQGINIAKYKLPDNVIIPTPLLLIALKHDKYVRKESYRKLQHIYPNSAIEYLDYPHDFMTQNATAIISEAANLIKRASIR